MNGRRFLWVAVLAVTLPLVVYAQLLPEAAKGASRLARPGTYKLLRPGPKMSVLSPGVLRTLRPTAVRLSPTQAPDLSRVLGPGPAHSTKQVCPFPAKKPTTAPVTGKQISKTVSQPQAAAFSGAAEVNTWELPSVYPFFAVPAPRPLHTQVLRPLPVGKLVLKNHEIEAVIFDMDGTLLNSLPAWEHACAKFLRTHGILLPPEIEREIEKMSLEQGARYIKEQLNLPMSEQELLKGTLSMVHQHYATDILPKRGAMETLVRLREQGVKVGVATSSKKDLAEMAFKRLGMSPYIDFVISCDEVGVGKNSPDVYEAARERLGSSRERTLVVEDALYALRTAKAAGFVTAGVEDTFHPPSYEAKVESESDYFLVSLEDIFKK